MDSWNLTSVSESGAPRGSSPEDSLVFFLGMLNLGAVTCYSIFNYLFRPNSASLSSSTQEFINRRVQSTLDELVLNVHMTTFYNNALERESRAHEALLSIQPSRTARQWVNFFDLPNKDEPLLPPSPVPALRISKTLPINSPLRQEFDKFLQASQSKLTREFLEIFGVTPLERQRRAVTGKKRSRSSNVTRNRRNSTGRSTRRKKPATDTDRIGTALPEFPESALPPPQSINEAANNDGTANIMMQTSMSFSQPGPKRVTGIGSAHSAPMSPFGPNSVNLAPRPRPYVPHHIPNPTTTTTSRTVTVRQKPSINLHLPHYHATSSSPVTSSVSSPGSVVGRLMYLIQQTTPLTLDFLSIYNGNHQAGRHLNPRCTQHRICEANQQWRRAGNVEAALAPFLSIALSWWSNGNIPAEIAMSQALMATRSGWMGNACNNLYPTQHCAPGPKWAITNTRNVPTLNNIPPTPPLPLRQEPAPLTWVTESVHNREHEANQEDDEEDQSSEDPEQEDEDTEASKHQESKEQPPVSYPGSKNPNPVVLKLPANWDRRDPGWPAPTRPSQKNNNQRPISPNPYQESEPDMSGGANFSVSSPTKPKQDSLEGQPDLKAVFDRQEEKFAQPPLVHQSLKSKQGTSVVEKIHLEVKDTSSDEESMLHASSEIENRVGKPPGSAIEYAPSTQQQVNVGINKAAPVQSNRDVIRHENTTSNKVTEVVPDYYRPWMGTPIWVAQSGSDREASGWFDGGQQDPNHEQRRVPELFTSADAILDKRRHQMITQYIRDRSVRP